MGSIDYDLSAVARQEMTDHGFSPDFSPEAAMQADGVQPAVLEHGVRDLRDLLWSSIDNDNSRDLDQVEYAERTDGGIRVLVGIADVDAAVPAGTPIDAHAASETTTVYAGIETFWMIPERLPTAITSLVEGAARMAIVVEFVVSRDGAIANSSVYRALVQNRARLTYSAAGPWLEGAAEAPEGLAIQLQLQDEASRALRRARERLGALRFERLEAQPVCADGRVTGMITRKKNRASELIEDFMIAANEVMARTLTAAGVSSIRRVVKSPSRWPRIVELAARFGERLPDAPNTAALNQFLLNRRASDPAHYADVSLAVIKLMGAGEYTVARPNQPSDGHFALAAHDYTHSTAPNRRYADLVTQRLVKAALAGAPGPYSDEELSAVAVQCTRMEDAARRVERAMQKRVAAAALQDRIGETFPAVVTGVASKGVFVRILEPPVEGRLVSGEEGCDVGDQFPVTLLSTDPVRGFIDFGR